MKTNLFDLQALLSTTLAAAAAQYPLGYAGLGYHPAAYGAVAPAAYHAIAPAAYHAAAPLAVAPAVAAPVVAADVPLGTSSTSLGLSVAKGGWRPK